MSEAIENLQRAMARAAKARPKVGGFPYLAEALRQAGVTRNLWTLPSAQSVFLTERGPVVMQRPPLALGAMEIPRFDHEALVAALRRDQAGESSFDAFLEASWQAGVVGYEVDFAARTVTYRGCRGETYVESYPAVELA